MVESKCVWWGTNHPVCGVLVLSNVKNSKNGNVLADAKVVLLDKANKIVSTKMTDASGNANFDVSCDEPYSLQISKEGFGLLQNIISELDEIDSIRCFFATLFLARDQKVDIEQVDDDIKIILIKEKFTN